ncbi:MAG: hypothetical protein ACTHMU_23055 [Thermomicrobiales bacterium]
MSPSIGLSLLLGSIYGLLCHAVVGQRWRQLPLYWAAGVVGFFAGYVGGVVGGLEFARLGVIPLLAATLGAVIALTAVYWLLSRRSDVSRGQLG